VRCRSSRRRSTTSRATTSLACSAERTMRVRFVTTRGVRTRCLEAGDATATPLLLVHGFGGMADLWLRNLEALGEHFPVIAPGLLCHGFTDLVELEGRLAHRAAVEHLHGLVETLGIGRFHLIGNSYGGLIAALLYLDRPERVSKLVIINSATCF